MVRVEPAGIHCHKHPGKQGQLDIKAPLKTQYEQMSEGFFLQLEAEKSQEDQPYFKIFSQGDAEKDPLRCRDEVFRGAVNTCCGAGHILKSG